MNSIALNIFTNCHESAPSTDIIRRTYDSFCDTFGYNLPVKVYCDKHPDISKLGEYFYNLSQIFDKNDIIITNSLSQGYIYSIQQATTDYLFQLENDWIFNKENINHDLKFITTVMNDLDIYHFRFNKRANVPAVWDKKIEEREIMGMKFCKSNNLSNNPHIISVKKYKNEIVKYISLTSGSKGIEERLNKVGNLYTAIYGGYGHPNTIEHLDGKKTCI